jgi:hypothetical protein
MVVDTAAPIPTTATAVGDMGQAVPISPEKAPRPRRRKPARPTTAATSSIVVDPIFAAIEAHRDAFADSLIAHDERQQARDRLPPAMRDTEPRVITSFNIAPDGQMQALYATTHERIDQTFDAMLACYRHFGDDVEHHFAHAVDLWREKAHQALDIVRAEFRQACDEAGVTEAEERVAETDRRQEATRDAITNILPTTPAGLAALASFVREFMDLARAYSQGADVAPMWALMTLETAAKRLAGDKRGHDREVAAGIEDADGTW